MDAVRREHEVEIRLDVPGYSPDEIDVTIEKNVVTVTASSTEETTNETEHYLTRERRAGTSRRQIVLSELLDGTKVSAHLENGVLRLTIPVVEQAKPQKVSVAVGSGGTGSPAIDARSSEMS